MFRATGEWWPNGRVWNLNQNKLLTTPKVIRKKINCGFGFKNRFNRFKKRNQEQRKKNRSTCHLQKSLISCILISCTKNSNKIKLNGKPENNTPILYKITIKIRRAVVGAHPLAKPIICKHLKQLYRFFCVLSYNGNILSKWTHSWYANKSECAAAATGIVVVARTHLQFVYILSACGLVVSLNKRIL